MSTTPSAAAEAAIKKLARMGGNTICPNCGVEKKFGFGTVCMKYLTFVCNECKSSHQAISHRCKSLTMSSWTDGEVIQIRTSGGNDRARATWLATAPLPGQNGRPTNGSSIDIYKSFIVNVYERKMYYREGTTSSDSDANVEISVPPAKPLQPTIQQQPQQQPPKQPQPVVDLLDFGAFETSSESVPVSNTTSTFADFNSAPHHATTSSVSNAAPIFDPFGSNATTNNNTNATSASTSSIDIFGAPIVAASATPTPAINNTFANFDPIGTNESKGTMGAMAHPMIPTKPPIMNNVSTSQNIGLMMSNSNAMGMGNGGNNIMMMNSNMFNNNSNNNHHHRAATTGSIGGAMMMNNNHSNNTIYSNSNNQMMYGVGNTTGSGMYGANGGNVNNSNNNNNIVMMMNGGMGFQQSQQQLSSMNNNNNNNKMMMGNTMMNVNMMNSNNLNNNSNIMMMNNGYNINNTNMGGMGNISMMNTTSLSSSSMNGGMGGTNFSNAKNISSNFGNISTTTSSGKHDPFANLGL